MDGYVWYNVFLIEEDVMGKVLSNSGWVDSGSVDGVVGCEVWSEEGEMIVLLDNVLSEVSEEVLMGEYKRLMGNDEYVDIMMDMVGEGDKLDGFVVDGEIGGEGEIGFCEFGIGVYVDGIKNDIKRMLS